MPQKKDQQSRTDFTASMGTGDRGKPQPNGVLNSNTILNLMDKSAGKKDQVNTDKANREASNANNILMKLSERKSNQQDVIA